MKKILLTFGIFLFVLDVQSQFIITGDRTDLDSCNFESICDFITLDSSAQNIWQIGKPNKQFFSSSLSELNSLITDTINVYPDTNHSSFLVALPGLYGNILIEFKHRINSDTLIDGGYIESSYDGGQTWANIIYDYNVTMPEAFNFENLYTESDTLRGGIPGFSGTSNDWIETKIQWIFYFPVRSEVPDTFLLRFNFISDSIQTGKDGWMIDDFKISYVSMCCGLNELPSSSIQIFPNPSKGVIHLQAKDNLSVQNISVLDLFGKEVYSTPMKQSNEIRVDFLAPGIYFVTFETDQGQVRKRVVIE